MRSQNQAHTFIKLQPGCTLKRKPIEPLLLIVWLCGNLDNAFEFLLTKTRSDLEMVRKAWTAGSPVSRSRQQGLERMLNPEPVPPLILQFSRQL